MAEDKTIYTSQGDSIPYLSKDVNNYLDRTTILLGPSSSGKTTIIDEILYLTKDYIPNYLVVVPKTSDIPYRKKLPARCIREDLSKSKLEAIWERQKNLTACYNIANDINILEGLFKKSPDRESVVMLQAIKRKAEESMRTIDASPNLDYAQKKSQRTSIEELHIKKTKAIYKASIKRNTHILERMELTTHEKTALEYLDVNPRFMIIIDDSSDKFEMWMKYWKKTEMNPFNSIFFRGRWNFITLVMALHEDKILDRQLMKNSRVTIFTNSQTFVTSIEKKSNGYSASEKKLAMRICDKVFPNDTVGGVKNFQKVCYVREDPQPFKYTIANLYPDFTLGGDGLRSLVNKMPKKEERVEDNPFIKELAKDSKQIPRKRR